jgi:mono/diheme cytochrome c family protein
LQHHFGATRILRSFATGVSAGRNVALAYSLLLPGPYENQHRLTSTRPRKERTKMNRASKLIAAGALAGAFLTALVTGNAMAEVDKKISRTWKAKCASCHGEDGKAATEQGKKMGVRDMTSAQFWKETTDAKMKDAILNGVKQTKDGKVQEMESYKDKLKPEDVDGLVGLIKTFKK